VVSLVYEAMEVHGGAGYIEESVMPRLFRQSPLNSIWEGSGNVICLDVLRALGRSREVRDAFVAELERGSGFMPLLDRTIETAKAGMSEAQKKPAPAAWWKTWRWRCRGSCSPRPRPLLSLRHSAGRV